MTTAIKGSDRTMYAGAIVSLRNRADRLESKALSLEVDGEACIAIARSMSKSENPETKARAPDIRGVGVTLAWQADAKMERCEILRDGADYALLNEENIEPFPGSARLVGRYRRIAGRIPKEKRSDYDKEFRSIILNAESVSSAAASLDKVFGDYCKPGYFGK